MSAGAFAEFHGTKEFSNTIDAMIEAAKVAAVAAIREAGKLVVAESRTGIHSVTGDLAASIIVTDPVSDGFGYTAQVGPSGVAYARKVELQKRGVHAYFAPGFSRAQTHFEQIFAKAWSEIRR